MHFLPGGLIGPHEAGFGQLFVALDGSGWVAGWPIERGCGRFPPKMTENVPSLRRCRPVAASALILTALAQDGLVGKSATSVRALKIWSLLG